jgi:bifunctional non-homologous end joining protein LigD
MTYIKVDNQEIEITHGERVLFPEIGVTKKDLINYYLNISNYILPLIKDRPITINCFPQGIESEGYFRQHPTQNLPTWLKTATLKKKDGSLMSHILCQDKKSLIYLINHNTITIHRWLSKYTAPTSPDIMVIDIDPPKGKFHVACKGAIFLREKANELGYKAFVMLTGAKGLHIVFPIIKKISFEDIRAILGNIILDLEHAYPNEFTSNIRKEKRDDFVYLDILRNSYGQTAIAPYSLKAEKEASIAMLTDWDELADPLLHPKKYNIFNIFSKLDKRKTDPWEYFYK